MTPKGPGYAPFPRHGVLRVNDLVGSAVDVGTVRAALAARGIPEGTRDQPVGNRVRALLVPTPAGTVVTLEARGGFRAPRFVVLRRLTATLDHLVDAVENDARGSRKQGRTRTDRRSGGS